MIRNEAKHRLTKGDNLPLDIELNTSRRKSQGYAKSGESLEERRWQSHSAAAAARYKAGVFSGRDETTGMGDLVMNTELNKFKAAEKTPGFRVSNEI